LGITCARDETVIIKKHERKIFFRFSILKN
jgi:hypothetical protein